ncbi:LuxR C-terminal-related transcriptional regulator [Arthrobacter koreensis]|uniref:LuxR C-terminal-related transcriptional regulator n=1 Tax=Arthrobacter koreensis TaxID=199136 RepID=A0ABY6FUX6_9MICC|nr:LuxR family transcriptional regulator [Arthrobacter koreensis]UYB37028.1 LuxR C-terminal-related transcriptional regulator [Arthrobacter koreensis]
MNHQASAAPEMLRSAEAEQVSNHLLDPMLRGAIVMAPEGMGKSALAEEVLRRLEGIVTPYRIHSSPVLARIPYGALTPFMERALAGDMDSPLMVLRNIRRFFRVRAEAGDAPALLVVEDAHHLDEASSHVLVQLAMSGELRLLVLSRARSTNLQELLSLARDGLLSRLNLQPLTQQAIHRLCVRELGGTVLRASSGVLARVSGGNPLYAKALLDGARRRGELLESNGSWYLRALSPGLEPTVQDLAKRLLMSRTDAQRAVLEAVALATAIPRPILTAFGDPASVQALIDEGYLAPVPEAADQLQLAQPLHTHAIRSLVPPVRSMEIRRQLMHSGGPAGGPYRDTLHAAWALDCGEAPKDTDLLQAARTANADGDSELALRLAQAVQPGPLGGRSRIEAAVAQLMLGNIADARAGLEDALAAAADAETLDLAVLASAQLAACSESAGKRLRNLARKWAERESLLQDHGSPRTDWVAAGQSVLALWARIADGDLLVPGESQATTRDLLDADTANPGRTAGQHELRALGYSLVCEAYTAAGAIQDALQAAGKAQRELELDPNSQSGVRAAVWVRRAFALLHGGNFAELEELLAGQLRAEPASLLAYGGSIGVLEGALEIHQGRFRKGLRRLKPAIGALRSKDPERLLPYAMSVAGYAAVVVDDDSPAARFAAELRGLGYSGPKGLQLAARAFAAAALAPQSSEEPPPAQVRSLAEEARALGQFAAEKDILELALAVGDLKQSKRLMDLTGFFEGGEAAALHAYAAAVAADNPERMVAAADEAVRRRKYLVAVECMGHAIRYYGAHNNLRRQRALIQQLRRRREELAGVTVAYLSPSVHQVRLTRREHEIVELLLEGAGSKDIATKFTLSQRTVEGHIYRIYVKLGISKRTELEAVYRALEAEPEAQRVP